MLPAGFVDEIDSFEVPKDVQEAQDSQPWLGGCFDDMRATTLFFNSAPE